MELFIVASLDEFQNFNVQNDSWIEFLERSPEEISEIIPRCISRGLPEEFLEEITGEISEVILEEIVVVQESKKALKPSLQKIPVDIFLKEPLEESLEEFLQEYKRNRLKNP